MATYNPISPVTLAALNAVMNDPQDTESANKLAQVDIQTRQFIYNYLSTKFSATTELLLPAVVDSTSLAGKVAGSTGNAGTQRSIVQGTVSTPDLRLLAVDTAQIADNAITAVKLNALAVQTAKIDNLAVTAGKIANGTITATQMAAASITATELKSDVTGAAGAVTTDHIRTGAVTSAKLAAAAVDTNALMVGAAAGNILVAGVAPYKFAAQAMSGDATIDKDGVLTLTQKNLCELIEQANNSVPAGATAATTWQVRGVVATGIGWVESWRVPTAAFVTFDAAGKLTMAAGSYYIEASAPAYKAGKHICRLVRYNSVGAIQETFYGTSEVAAATDGTQTRTFVKAKITVAASNDYLQLEHYSELVEAVDGLGFPTSSGGTYEVYASILIQRLS